MNNVHSAFAAAQKRRLSESESKTPDAPINAQEQPEAKQRKTEQEELQQTSSNHNLLTLCDEVLYEIFKYLDSSSIMALMHCSPRFETLLLDHRFWHNIDLSNAPLPLGILEEILGRASEKTHTIKICGPPSSQHVAGEFKQFTCTLTSVFPKVATQLRVLELQGVSLDFEYIHISEFPASLKRLTLKDCSVKLGDQMKSIFHTIEKQLINLEDLSVEDNDWFEPYYIMALSKLPSLRRLSLKGCRMMCKFVPYGSMAARFGFQKLEVLDLRLTPINNSDLQCFSAIESLRELLLESPPEAMKASHCWHGRNPIPTQSKPVKLLNDDEPSTSRAAMQFLRAFGVTSDNCNERKDTNDNDRPSTSGAKPLGCASSESDDEDTSSTSASSSDKSDNATTHSNGHGSESGALGTVSSPVVVIALPSVVPDRSPPQAENAENAENPEPAAAAGAATPRAYVYVQNGTPPENPRPNASPGLDQVLNQMHTLYGNHPAHSRFLPRADQVIYMNPHILGDQSVLMPRRHNRRGIFDQVVNHPVFWDVLDPLDRNHSRRLRAMAQTSSPPVQYLVSDRAIYSFGRAANPVQPDVVWIRNSNRSPTNRLERVLLRNYTYITNFTLEHLVQCSPNLIYIDVSGTSVTLSGLRNFKNLKPHCEVIATHLETSAQSTESEEVVKEEQETESAPNENLSTDSDDDDDDEELQPLPQSHSHSEQESQPESHLNRLQQPDAEP